MPRQRPPAPLQDLVLDLDRYQVLPLDVVDDQEIVTLNLRIDGKRTSMRIDKATREAFRAMLAAEGFDRHAVATLVAARLRPGISLSAALRTLVLAYWRRERTEDIPHPCTWT